MDDNYLIDLYRATMSDSGQERQRLLKQSLRKIGQSRDSKTILNVASVLYSVCQANKPPTTAGQFWLLFDEN